MSNRILIPPEFWRKPKCPHCGAGGTTQGFVLFPEPLGDGKFGIQFEQKRVVCGTCRLVIFADVDFSATTLALPEHDWEDLGVHRQDGFAVYVDHCRKCNQFINAPKLWIDGEIHPAGARLKFRQSNAKPCVP